jgi:predicted nuclease of predicted toxin-antitoxin system
MSFKFLIDECLSPELVEMAVAAGHVESTCVRDRGWSGKKDWELIQLVIAGDFTLVTNNAEDFRGGGKDKLGGEHARQEIHAGLVCLQSPRMSPRKQRELFQFALDALAGVPELVNQALEVFEDDDGQVTVEIYDIP